MISIWQFQPLRALVHVLQGGRSGLPAVALALLLQLHHLREHAADPEQRSLGAVHHEGYPPTRIDDTVPHGTGGRTGVTGRRACHGVLLRPQETDAVPGDSRADAQHPWTAGDRVGSQHGGLSR